MHVIQGYLSILPVQVEIGIATYNHLTRITNLLYTLSPPLHKYQFIIMSC